MEVSTAIAESQAEATDGAASNNMQLAIDFGDVVSLSLLQSVTHSSFPCTLSLYYLPRLPLSSLDVFESRAILYSAHGVKKF